MERALKDTTITMSAGGQSATVSGEDFEAATRHLAGQEGFTDSGRAPQQGHLFAVLAGARPTVSEFSISGSFDGGEQELAMRTAVRVVLIDDDGEEIAAETGIITTVAVAEKKDADGDSITARVHKIKLGG
jgi:hypothetical protein